MQELKDGEHSAALQQGFASISLWLVQIMHGFDVLSHAGGTVSSHKGTLTLCGGRRVRIPCDRRPEVLPELLVWLCVHGGNAFTQGWRNQQVAGMMCIMASWLCSTGHPTLSSEQL